MNWFQSGIRSLDNLGRILVLFMRKIRWPVTSAICRFLIRLHVNQSHLTLSRIFLLVGFYFVWVSSFFTLALVLVLSAWVLDCLDGDLSRILGHDTPLGEFEDVMADNFACLIFPLSLIQRGMLNGVWGALFIYSAFNVLWLANRNQPQDVDRAELVFRPKGDIILSLSRKAIWVVMYAFLFFRISIFNPTYVVTSVVLCVSTIINYYQIIKSRL